MVHSPGLASGLGSYRRGQLASGSAGPQGDPGYLSGQWEPQGTDSYVEMATPSPGRSNMGQELPLGVSGLIQVLFEVREKC